MNFHDYFHKVDAKYLRSTTAVFLLNLSKYTCVREVFQHLEQNDFTATSILVRPTKRYSLETYLIILNGLMWWEKISRYRLSKVWNIRYEFLLQIMRTVWKKIVQKTQELPNEERLAVQYSRKSLMPFQKTLYGNWIVIFLMHYNFIVSLFLLVLLR